MFKSIKDKLEQRRIRKLSREVFSVYNRNLNFCKEKGLTPYDVMLDLNEGYVYPSDNKISYSCRAILDKDCDEHYIHLDDRKEEESLFSKYVTHVELSKQIDRIEEYKRKHIQDMVETTSETLFLEEIDKLLNEE